MIEESRFPLQWPEGSPRAKSRRKSPFSKVRSLEQTRQNLFRQLYASGGQNLTLSTNIPTRNDGQPYSNWKQPSDPGVACYFTRKGKRLVVAADAFVRVEDNIHALACLIEDLRKHERYGVGQMVDQAYTGFAALPPPVREEKPWWEVLGVNESDDLWWIEAVFKKALKTHHPDVGGSGEVMVELNRSIEQARKAKGKAA